MSLDYIYLGIAHALREPMLMASFVIKVSFFVIELSLIIVFRITAHTNYNQNNMAATLEWGMSTAFDVRYSVLMNSVVIAFVFTGYVLSLIVDQLPSSQRNLKDPKGYQQLEMSTAMSLP